MTGTRRVAALVLLAFCWLANPAAAQDFYAGKQVNLVVGSAVGGGYDSYARLVARHWPKFIPGNPSMVVQNVPAAGSLVAMNTLANTAPRDGTTIGAVQNHIGIEPVMGITGPPENAKYDGRKMSWIGSAAKEYPVVVAGQTAPIKRFEDVLQKEMVVGSSGVATADAVYGRVMNQLLGAKFRLIDGYKGNPELTLAIENGEIMGRAGWFLSSLLATQGEQLTSGKLRVLAQVALEKHPALPEVPLVTEFSKGPEIRQQLEFALSWMAMGRPFVAPPGVPAERLKILRDSFMQTMASPDFLAEARKLALDVSPMSGEEVQALVEKIYATPPSVIENVRKIMLPK
jgi:tripartite-type tricarboxylate transporter receptor subunit TctC